MLANPYRSNINTLRRLQSQTKLQTARLVLARTKIGLYCFWRCLLVLVSPQKHMESVEPYCNIRRRTSSEQYFEMRSKYNCKKKQARPEDKHDNENYFLFQHKFPPQQWYRQQMRCLKEGIIQLF